MRCRVSQLGETNAAGILLLHFATTQKQAIPGIGEFLVAFKACGAVKELDLGRKLHLDCCSSSSSAGIIIDVANSIMSMYAKCGSIVEARRVFDSMKQRDNISWNTLILGYTTNGDHHQALNLFSQLQNIGVPDSRTYVSACMACSGLAKSEQASLVDGKLLKVNALHRGTVLHARARELRFDSDGYLAGALVCMYSKCGSMDDARLVFDSMVSPCVVAWTSLILGYAENGQEEVALELFDHMQQQEQTGASPNARTFVAALVACTGLRMKDRGKPCEGFTRVKCLELGRSLHEQASKRGFGSDIFVASSLIDMYSKCGSLGEARTIFARLERHDVVTWTTMIQGFAENGEGREALSVFEMMQAKGCRANNQTRVAVLTACEALLSEEQNPEVMKLECLEKVMQVHSGVSRADIIVENALIDLYSKCGSVLDARGVFDRMKLHNVVSWTSLLHGYSHNEEHELALETFVAMKSSRDCSPDAQAFVAALVACSGLADSQTGAAVHREVCRAGALDNRIVGNCLVDFYGRCGNPLKAEHLFDSLAVRDVVAWSSLLAALSRVGDSDGVFQVFEEMKSAGVEANAVTYLLLLSACNHAGLVDKGKGLLEGMMLGKVGARPEIEHFHCIIDLLGRVGRVDEAMAMAKTMPFPATEITWTIVLSACEKWKNVELGGVAFESLVGLNHKLPAAYSLMYNLSCT